MKGILPIGIEYEGQKHREFEVRPRKVRDSIDAANDSEVAGDDALLGLAILVNQIVAIGSIPKEAITWRLLYEAWEDDIKEIDAKTKEAAAGLRTFSGNGQNGQEDRSGADETGTQQG